VDGDGGFMFNIQELETIHRLHLPFKFFVLNNDGYASIRASQRALFGKPALVPTRTLGLTISKSEYGWLFIRPRHRRDCRSDESSLRRAQGAEYEGSCCL